LFLFAKLNISLQNSGFTNYIYTENDLFIYFSFVSLSLREDLINKYWCH